MIFHALYAFIGLLIAAGIMVLVENRGIPDDEGDRFFFALILVLSCGAFWPVVGSAVAIMLVGEWAS